MSLRSTRFSFVEHGTIGADAIGAMDDRGRLKRRTNTLLSVIIKANRADALRVPRSACCSCADLN